VEEEKQDKGMTEKDMPEDLTIVEGRRGPTWRGWVLSILVAIILSVTATLLLGGSGIFRPDRAASGTGDCGSGGGSSNCPHSTSRK
jgi:hypothetical protein